MRNNLLFGLQEDSSREQQQQIAHPTKAVMAPSNKTQPRSLPGSGCRVGAVVVLCVASFLCCRTLMMLCRRFVFGNQVMLNSSSNWISINSTWLYWWVWSMIVTELAKPARRDWGRSPWRNSRRARLAPWLAEETRRESFGQWGRGSENAGMKTIWLDYIVPGIVFV